LMAGTPVSAGGERICDPDSGLPVTMGRCGKSCAHSRCAGQSRISAAAPGVARRHGGSRALRRFGASRQSPT
jgi:hypothetical protein